MTSRLFNNCMIVFASTLKGGIALEANPFYMVEGTSGRVRLHSLSQPINPVTVTISTVFDIIFYKI